MKPIIAYISQKLPNLTETFVYREIFALRAQGFTVMPLSIHAPDVDNLSAEAHALAHETHYAFPLNKWRFLTTHAYFLLTRPHRYLHTLYFVLTRPGEKRDKRQRTLYHFGEAVYLAAEVQRRGVRHVHAHFSVNAATIALVLARLLGISFSFTAHNNIFTDQLILKEKMREAKFIAVISEYSRDFMLKLLPDEPELAAKFHLIHCGIAPEQFEPPTESTPADPPLIFSVAQLAERKGMPVLIEACRILAERAIPFQCVIAGDGPQRPLLTELISRYQLEAQVQLVGVVYQEALHDYFKRTSIFAMACLTTPSGDMDGIPVALMEAMAMGIPTVSTTVSGIPELIETEISGLLVPEQEPVALADALQRLLTDATLRDKLSQGGRQKVLNSFNIHRTSAQMAALFIDQWR